VNMSSLISKQRENFMIKLIVTQTRAITQTVSV